MPRRFFIGLTIVVLALAALWIAYLWRTAPTSGINRVTANRIRIGMSEEDVVATIGLPSGGQGGGGEPLFEAVPRLVSQHQARLGWMKFWSNKDGAVVVGFDTIETKVIFAEFVPAREGPWDRVRGWFAAKPAPVGMTTGVAVEVPARTELPASAAD